MKFVGVRSEFVQWFMKFWRVVRNGVDLGCFEKFKKGQHLTLGRCGLVGLDRRDLVIALRLLFFKLTRYF